jgi:hypothetical protein
MKKTKLTVHETILIVMLIISIILVIASWTRVKEQTIKVFEYYLTS